VERIYSTFGLSFHLELSTRPKKSIGTDDQWERATNGLDAALKAYGQEYKVNPGDGAFYGPKIDVHIKDALGRTWQCGTIQLDLSLPERFDLSYIGKDNEKHRPIMIHRVIYGSVERFLGILVEHFAGKFPLWLAPVQATLLPINDGLIDFAETVQQELEAAGINTVVDKRTESLNKKVREAQLEKIPLILTMGEKEKEAGTLSVRTLDGKVRYGMAKDTFITCIKNHIATRDSGWDIFIDD
jgi:threonyl-tRNA synthetase